MAVLNIRGVPDDLHRAVKSTAASEGKKIPVFVIEVLERDLRLRRGGWTAAREETENGAKKADGRVRTASRQKKSAGKKDSQAEEESEEVEGDGAKGSPRSSDSPRVWESVEAARKRLKAHPVEVRIADEPRLQAALAGRLDHAPNCSCLTCKPPKEEK